MSNAHLDTVKALYDAFAAGDIPAALAVRRQNIWHRWLRKLAEHRPRLVS
jgi:hypothetical protein